MQKKTIAMMAAAGCMIGMLTGCGIPEEEHLAIIAELEAKHQKAVDELNVTVTDKESVIDSQKAKLKTKSIELDDAAGKISDLKKQNAMTSKALAAEKAKIPGLERALASAKSATAAAEDAALEAENKLAALQSEHETLKNRFEQFEKNMRALSQTPTGAPAAATTPAPAAGGETALDILNQMSTQ